MNRMAKWYMGSGPRSLNIFTTNRCNFSCAYCNRNIKDDSPTFKNKYTGSCDFKYEYLKCLLDKYPSIKRVSFVGIGEPFLIHDIIEMAKLAKKYNKKTSAITNASLLHHYWGNIAESFDSISISIHGTNAIDLSNNSNVGSAIFDQLIYNINYLALVESKLNPSMIIRASVVILKSDMNRLENTANFCIKNNIKTLDLQNYLPYDIRDRNMCIFDNDTMYINYIDNLINKYRNLIKINRPILIKRDFKTMSNSCDSFFNMLRVDGFGHICGCARMLIPCAENGNFRVERDVWNNSYFKTGRKNLLANQHISECCRYCPDAQ